MNIDINKMEEIYWTAVENKRKFDDLWNRHARGEPGLEDEIYKLQYANLYDDILTFFKEVVVHDAIITE